jgi:hypothetical protein
MQLGCLPLERTCRLLAAVMLFAALTLASPGCAGEPPKEGKCPLADAKESLQIARRFRAEVAKAPKTLETDYALRFVSSLNAAERHSLGHGLSSSDERSELEWAMGMLSQTQCRNDTAAVLARLAKTGQFDMGSLSWGAMHSDGRREKKPTTSPEQAMIELVCLYTRSGRLLLKEYPMLTGAKRRNVEHFLMDGGFGEKLPSFSVEAATKRIARLEENCK